MEADRPVANSRVSRIRESLFSQVDGSALVFFRMAFGAILFWEVSRYFYYGWIDRYWIEPEFFFTYEGFGWISPWAGNGMYVHFLILGVLAVFITIGFLYRLSAVLFFLGFTYVFLLDKTNYLNHFYLISLLSFLLIFLPAHRRAAVDAYLGLSRSSDQVPYWSIWLLRIQLGIVYFFGGVAKINPDWLRGIPLDRWLSQATDFPIFGPYFGEEWAVLLFAYGGLLLDLLAFPLLVWPKTRKYIFGVLVLFHLSNAWLFSIGIFPWFMIAATTIYFRPDWCRRIIPNTDRIATVYRGWRPPENRRLTMSLIGVYVVIQLLVPLRHWLYPGNPNWTEEGHRFSWHMKLRTKSGKAEFRVVEERTGREIRVDPKKLLSRRQVSKMAGRPDMILQFSHYLARIYQRPGQGNVAVYADTRVRLNGHRPARPLVDPDVNLAAVRPSLLPASWILPWEQPPPNAE